MIVWILTYFEKKLFSKGTFCTFNYTKIQNTQYKKGENIEKQIYYCVLRIPFPTQKLVNKLEFATRSKSLHSKIFGFQHLERTLLFPDDL
jgi:hypothetical protein